MIALKGLRNAEPVDRIRVSTGVFAGVSIWRWDALRAHCRLPGKIGCDDHQLMTRRMAKNAVDDGKLSGYRSATPIQTGARRKR